MNNAVVEMPVEKSDRTQVTAITPMTMLNMAVSQGADLDKLEKLMALQEKWEANEARKAFNEAMGAFKAEAVTVGKNSRVFFKTSAGTTDYMHASLGHICNVLGPAMSAHGLSYRWNTQQTDGRIKVTCIVSHRLGHSESVCLDGAADTSGGKNNIQAIGSTVSYLQRYTLLAATGTATEEQDDDGEGGDKGDGSAPNDKKKADPKNGGKAEIIKCTAEAFDDIRKSKNRELVKSGKRSPADMITWLSAKVILTDEQKLEIDSWSHELDGVEINEPGAGG